MSRVLLVSPFAPYRDGIAVYAQQELRRLIDSGCTVEVCSPLPSAAEHHHGIGGPKGMLALQATARAFDRVIIQFYPELVFGGCRTAGQRVVQWGLLAALSRSAELEIRVHEIDYTALAANALERRAARLAMQSAAQVTMHTEEERSQLCAALDLDPASISLVDHGQSFVARYTGTKEDARRELGLNPDEHVFLSIGFLQAHKGFDRGIEAFNKLNSSSAQLHVVGSARVDHPEVVSHVGLLRRLVAANPAAHLHVGFVGDVEFDRWLTAADTLVLPYREIWSSGVVERAKLFDLVVIATAVGGLVGQVDSHAILVDSDQALADAMVQRVQPGRSAVPSPGVDDLQERAERSSWIIEGNEPDRHSIQHQVRRRAGGMTNEDSTSDPLWLPLAELGEPLERPLATSARPGVAQVKRVVQALTWWQIHPLNERVRRLEQASLAVARQTDAAVRSLQEDSGFTDES